MKNLSIVFILLLLLPFIGFAQNTAVQKNEAPPLLMPQTQTPDMTLPAPGPLPVPLPPAPPAGPAPVAPIQTIPVQTVLNNLNTAIATAEKVNKLLIGGKVWVTRAPAGEIEVKKGLMYRGAVVALLRIDPTNGNILPSGIVPHVYENKVRLQPINGRLSSEIRKLKILPYAEYLEPEACWLFPVVLNNIIVTHLKIYYDGIHVVQDYIANQEMVLYGN